MSRENVELVRAVHPTGVDLVEFFGADAAAEAAFVEYGPGDAFADAFQVCFVGEGVFEMLYQGVEGFVEGWRDWLEPWASYRMEVEGFLDAGDKVVTMVHVSGKTARDGVSMEHSPASVWSIRDGKIVEVRFYLDRKRALASAGLSEREAEFP